ncbi:hypothetical protein [Devosia beringensis]|uniref:hypothetical protein n=1 Tax=Devosia beringensis TaxID=2657486 RepID=UPI00186B663F|nr:hypothetical protein [Devosia beringensis]
MTDLGHHRAYLADAVAAAQGAPLSRRKALLAALLIDAQVDRLFAAGGLGDDILEFRAALAAASPALKLVLDLCAQRAYGPQLVLEALTVPVADYGRLSVEDFMVSLYNDHSVQRLLLLDGDGVRHDVMATLGDALAALDELA